MKTIKLATLDQNFLDELANRLPISITKESLNLFYHKFLLEVKSSKTELFNSLFFDEKSKSYKVDTSLPYFKYFMYGKCNFFDCNELVGSDHESALTQIGNKIKGSDDTGRLENICLFDNNYTIEPVIGNMFTDIQEQEGLISRQNFPDGRFLGVKKNTGRNQIQELIRAVKEGRNHNVSLNSSMYNVDRIQFQNNYIETIQFTCDKTYGSGQLLVIFNDMYENNLLLDEQEFADFKAMKLVEFYIYASVFFKALSELPLGDSNAAEPTMKILYYEETF